MMLRALEIFRRRKLIALVVFATVFASAVTFALYLPNLYRATAVVLVERPVSETFVRTAVTGELESRLHIIKQEILSRARLTDLITRYNLYPELRRGGQIDGALDQMRRDVVVEPTGPEMLSGRIKTVAFNLHYTGERQDTVADVANEIANFYVAQNDAMRSNEAVKTTQFLKTQLDEAKKQLDSHEGRLRAYTTAHNGELAATGRHEPGDPRAPQHAAPADQRAADSHARTAAAPAGDDSRDGRCCPFVSPGIPGRRTHSNRKSRTSVNSKQGLRANIPMCFG